MTGFKSDNDEVLRKIKRCMDLSKSSNEHESALALKQMQALMKKYNLTESQALARDVNEAMFELSVKKRVPQWIFNLHHTIAQALDCKSLITVGGVYNAKMILVGVGSSPEIANYAFEVLFRKIKADRTKFIAEQSVRMKRSNKTKLADAYCEGWILSVYRKVENLNPNLEAEKAVNAYFEAGNIQLTKDLVKALDRNSKRSTASDMARSKGFYDSADVDLFVATENKSQKLIGN